MFTFDDMIWSFIAGATFMIAANFIDSLVRRLHPPSWVVAVVVAVWFMPPMVGVTLKLLGYWPW